MPSDSSSPPLDAAAEAEAKWLAQALLGRADCDIFRELVGLRNHVLAMGVTPRFRSPPPDLAVQRSNAMYEVLQSMDQGPNSGHPPGFARRTAWFLVIGSDSDGFARYILDHSRARGVGIIPPVGEGGTGWAIPPSDRFELHELDLFNLVALYLQSDPASRVLPFQRTSFDFIIVDLDLSNTRVLIAQLLLALHTVYNGGQILLTLSSIERPYAARTLIAFSRVADLVTTSRPQAQAWGHRFYLHVQTVRHDRPYRMLKHNLHHLWAFGIDSDQTD
ncbi:unnamed protein product [Rhizoctonia solani]|uniref:Ribosomal RNA methyltransferase FtsJ domain-containing protein n=1 Tax=Rhizoctonia solani TaxID=456999 RepID=A0A8H3E085_9AGAM|nr:unnamed protein product [Rhizoctonia solani]